MLNSVVGEHLITMTGKEAMLSAEKTRKKEMFPINAVATTVPCFIYYPVIPYLAKLLFNVKTLSQPFLV